MSMFDPLSTPYDPSGSTAWSSETSSNIPDTPPKSPRPPLPPNPSGPPGREPQIYGEPGAGLISPSAQFEKKDKYLRVRVIALDRNRRDIIVRMDAQTNLPTYTGTSYRGISRSYVEFQNLHSQLVYANPQTIIPALPLPQTSAPSDEEDDRIIKIMLQRWLNRICDDSVVLRDDELRSFVEGEFGYQPTPRPKRKTSTGFTLIRRAPPDEDEQLQQARFELTKLEGLFFDAAKAVDKVARSRKAISAVEVELGNKLISVATTEAHPPLATAMRKFGRVYHIAGDINQAQAMNECTILGDSMGYLGLNARAGKETLQQRGMALEEYQAAVKGSISKRRNIERLKAASSIRPDRVDEALEDLEEANKYEQTLARRVEGISTNLHRALQVHARQVDDDLFTGLIEHVRSTLLYERQLLKELEALRVDVANAASPAAPAKKPIPPAIMTPPSVLSPPPSQQPQPQPQPQQSHSAYPQPQQPYPQSFARSHAGLQRPASAAPLIPAQAQAQAQTQTQSPRPVNAIPNASPGPATPRSAYQSQQMPPQSPGAGSSKGGGGGYPSPLHDSNFVSPAPSMSPHQPSEPYTHTPVSPLHQPGVPMTQSMFLPPRGGGDDVLTNTLVDPNRVGMVDPLSQSVRIQPQRRRLDAREAASKLANFL